ncbi:hypothetical protein SNN87_001291 [Cronobacter sakazakii]|nr:hypothetical protein [Cronobacter sakazakii]
MSEMSEEALAAACEEKVKQLEFSVKQSAFDSVRQELKTELAIARVALLALRKERERSVPVSESGHVRREVHVGGNTWVQCSTQAYERAKGEGKITRELYERPAPPVAVPDEVVESLNLLLSRSYFQRWVKDPRGYVGGSIPVSDLVNVVLFADACRAAMLAAPGKEG